MDIFELTFTSELLTQLGLAAGFIGVVLLAFSIKVGIISEGGQIIFHGLDPNHPSDDNEKKVLRSHWRNRYFTPIGWFLLALSFCLQLMGTL